ncbi:MAG: GAF domain-containing sensor histidine kinase [Chloroflexi bacterium]|nr:GAF domain-containing sensor histidine kinase [Chloroflexota bacterium]
MTADTDRTSLLTAMSDSILAMAGEPRLEPVLRRLVEGAKELVDARYAAIGVPDDEGEGFGEFIYTGMSDELVANIGPLPLQHGLLAAMLQEKEPYRAADIKKDPRFNWWPDAHPRMASFLGVPIASRGNVIGAFYLTDKESASEFSQADQEAIVLLAAHAAVAIENARLYELTRELSVVEERNRLARDLHDSVSQTLFSMTLTAEAALAAIDKDPQAAATEVANIRDLSRAALQEMRSLIFELRPADLESDGLVATLEKHVDVMRRTGRGDVYIEAGAYVPQPIAIEQVLFRIAQESLNNASKHAAAGRIDLELKIEDGNVRLSVTDDGDGFDVSDPQIRAHRLGITSMEERADELGGRLRIESAKGKGTRVVLEVPIA